MPSACQRLPIFYLSPNSCLPDSTVIYPTAVSILRHLPSNRYFKLIMPKPDFWAALQNLLRLFLPSSRLMKPHPSRWPGLNPKYNALVSATILSVISAIASCLPVLPLSTTHCSQHDSQGNFFKTRHLVTFLQGKLCNGSLFQSR